MQSRPIFNKSTRFEDMRNFDDERVPFRRPSVKKYFSSYTINSFVYVIAFISKASSNSHNTFNLSNRPMNKGGGMQSRDDDLDLAEYSQ